MFDQQVALDPQQGAITSIPAPTKGWNRRDPLQNMKPGFAVVLDNWFPLPYSIQLRAGSEDWATGVTDEGAPAAETTVNTLIAYRPVSGAQELWAFSGARLFDVTADGAVGASELATLTNDQWNCINFSTGGTNYLLCLNGADKMLVYDGTTWLSVDNASAPISITGVSTPNLLNLFVHKQRPYYIEKSSLSLWYPAVGAIGGALTKLDLSSVFTKGGYLVAGGTWSADAGDGKDDFWCALTSEGELVVYQGDDPGVAASWVLVGVFELGKPIGKRCIRKYGGDLMILTVDGIISATAAFQRGREDAKQLAITDVIQGAVAESGGLYKDTYGWQMTLFSEASMMLVNVPESDGTKQWAMNTVTKAWGRFKGWDATCFEVFNGSLYFGTAGGVVKAWTGVSDRGDAITAEVVPAFSYYGQPGIAKQWTMLSPNIEWDSNPLSIKVGFDVDFVLETPTQEIALTAASSGGIFDSSLWDGAVWAGSVVVQTDWYAVDGFGLAGAPHLIFESDVSTARITSFGVSFKKGALFG